MKTLCCGLPLQYLLTSFSELECLHTGIPVFVYWAFIVELHMALIDCIYMLKNVLFCITKRCPWLAFICWCWVTSKPLQMMKLKVVNKIYGLVVAYTLSGILFFHKFHKKYVILERLYISVEIKYQVLDNETKNGILEILNVMQLIRENNLSWKILCIRCMLTSGHP